MPFYAVRKGRQVGIYLTWAECEAQVKKFSGAQFKKFATESDAQAFIDAGPTCSTVPEPLISRKRSFAAVEDDGCSTAESSAALDSSSDNKRHRSSDLADDGSPFTVVYTDGACTNNGYGDALGGIGVYWGPGDERNISEPLPRGRQTNNRAEILACAKAVEQATKFGIKNLEIRTDSRFTINCMTNYLPGWLKSGWLKVSGQPVLNKEELLILHERKLKFEATGGRVKFVHVSGHSGEPGNEAADRLAVEGIQKA